MSNTFVIGFGAMLYQLTVGNLAGFSLAKSKSTP